MSLAELARDNYGDLQAYIGSKKMPMNKYGYRGFVFLVLIIILDAFWGTGYLWKTILFPFALLLFLIPPDESPFFVVSCIIFVAIVVSLPLYAFLYSWLQAEMPDPNASKSKNIINKFILFGILGLSLNTKQNLQQENTSFPILNNSLRKNIEWLIIFIALFPLLFASFFSVDKHVEALNVLKEIEDLKKVSVENYTEIPVQLWGSQLPIGLKVEFDIVGGNQQNKIAIMNAQIILDIDNSREEIRVACHANNIELAEKKKIAGRFYEGNVGNWHLLKNVNRNHVSFTCRTRNFVFDADDNALCVRPIEIEKISMVADGFPIKVISENFELTFMNLVPRGDVSDFVDADASLKDDIPQNALLFDPAFWIKNMTDYENIPSADSGFVHCPELEKEYREGTKVACFCKSTP